jgi:hypothetical protein
MKGGNLALAIYIWKPKKDKGRTWSEFMGSSWVFKFK